MTVIGVGPEAVNFDQIQKGDIVDALVSEELVVRMGSSADELNDGEVAAAVLAPKGAAPGGVVVGTVQITATVSAIDGLARTATLLLEDGTLKTVAVRDDIDLTQHRIGDKIVFEVTRMVALSIDKK